MNEPRPPLMTRIASALGFRSIAVRELPSAAPKLGTTVVPDLALWQQFSRIGGGLTPQAVSEIIRDADGGYMARLIDLANESRQKDGHMHGCLSQSEESIASLEWSIVAPDGATPTEKLAAEHVELALRKTDDMPRTIAHLAGAVFYGYAVVEIVWGLDGRMLVPSELRALDARRFGFRRADGRFIFREALSRGEGFDFRAEHPFKFIVSQPRVNGDVPCREGLARLLVWSALFRNWTILDWLRLGEIAWKPWRIGKYTKEANEEDVDELVDVLEGMSANGVAVIPESVEIDVKWAPNASNKPMHETLFESVAREMSKAILGQTETVQSSQSSGYAQASVLNDVRKELRDARAAQVAADITRDLVRAMVSLNFGGDVRAPSLYFNTQDTVDLAAFAAGVKDLHDAGTEIPQAWVRDVAGIPEPSEGEAVLGTTTPIEAPQDDAKE